MERTKKEMEDIILRFKAAADELIDAADDLTNAEADPRKASELSRCLDGLQSQVYDPGRHYDHSMRPEGLTALERYVASMPDGESTQIYKEVPFAELVKVFDEWTARWEKEPYPGSGVVSIGMPLLAFDDGSDGSFPDEARNLWAYLDKDGFIEWFRTKIGALAYIGSDGEDESDKVEI